MARPVAMPGGFDFAFLLLSLTALPSFVAPVSLDQ